MRSVHLIDHAMEEGKIKLARMGLHAVPGKFGDTHGIHADALHLFDIPVDLAFIPILGIIGDAQIGRLSVQHGVHAPVSKCFSLLLFYHIVLIVARGRQDAALKSA